MSELDSAHKREVEMAEASGQDTEAIDTKYNEKKKKIAKRQKAMAAAQATIDTYTSAVAAYKSMVGVPYVGPVLAPIAAGAAVMAGLASVRKIYATDVGDGGGGGGGGSTPTPSSPKAGKVPSAGRFSLGQGQEDAPVKAYVVTDEMSNSQDQLENIRRRATI